MNKFWGASASGSVQKLSRDENQLLALNYENLCDGDYLTRLFSSGTTGESSSTTIEGGGGSHNTTSQAHMKDNESWILASDVAEDIVLFGDDSNLGKDLLQKRFLRSLSSVTINQDALSILVQRQVVVFENIGQLVSTKCSSLVDGIDSQTNTINAVSSTTSTSSPIHLASEALLCSMKALEIHSRSQLQRTAVEPIISLMVNMFQERSAMAAATSSSSSEGKLHPSALFDIHEQHFQCLREILCNGVLHGTESFSSFSVGLKLKEKEEHFRLCLSSAYGFLATGTHSLLFVTHCFLVLIHPLLHLLILLYHSFRFIYQKCW